MSALGIYLVRNTPYRVSKVGIREREPERLALVVAESATSAADIVSIRGGEYVAEVPEDGVGRLGDYEPGMEGYRMVVNRGLIVLEAEA